MSSFSSAGSGDTIVYRTLGPPDTPSMHYEVSGTHLCNIRFSEGEPHCGTRSGTCRQTFQTPEVTHISMRQNPTRGSPSIYCVYGVPFLSASACSDNVTHHSPRPDLGFLSRVLVHGSSRGLRVEDTIFRSPLVLVILVRSRTMLTDITILITAPFSPPLARTVSEQR